MAPRLGADLRLRDGWARSSRDAADGAMRAGSALPEQLSEFAQVLANGPVGAAFVSVDAASFGRYLWVNRAMCQITGYSEEQLLQTDFQSITQRDDARRGVEGVQRLLRGEIDSFHIEKRYVRDKGPATWALLSASLVNDRHGPPLGVFVQLQDITARKAIEHELQQGRDFLQVLLENLSDGILACDVKGVVTFSNRAWLELHGVSKPPPTADHQSEYYELFPLDGTEPLSGRGSPLALALAGHRLRNVEAVLHTRAGDRRTVTVNAQSVLDPRGEKVGAVVAVRDLSAQRQAEAEVAHHVLHDDLTGCPGRALFLARLGEAITHARRTGSRCAVLIADIDRLRDYNDYLGHAGGDEVLRTVASRLQDLARPGDTVGRVGGDEFALVVQDLAGEKEAVNLARRGLEALSRPFDAAGTAVTVTAALGIAFADNEAEPEEVMGDAEAALGRAKQEAAGSYAVFAKKMRKDRLVRADKGRALLEALQEGQLRLLYQPKVSLETERVMGVEALMRWEHPDRGTRPAGDFIPLAEETGLIVPMGAWALEEACRQGARWRASFPDRVPLLVSVNVSPRQFQAGLVDAVKRALVTGTFDATTLCLEVTESAVMDDVEVAIALLGALKSLGITLSIDDFGTGHSSLAYLRRFPLDLLKVDHSFVGGLGRDEEDTAMVAGIIAMAHALNMRVVAECVETEEQLGRLRTLGCDYAQGYYFARPQSPEGIHALLATEASITPPRLGRRRHAETFVVVAGDSTDARLLARISLCPPASTWWRPAPAKRRAPCPAKLSQTAWCSTS